MEKKKILLEQSYKRQNLSAVPHREDCESFLRALWFRSQVRMLVALLSKHASSSHRGRVGMKGGAGEKEWRGAERRRGQTSL